MTKNQGRITYDHSHLSITVNSVTLTRMVLQLQSLPICQQQQMDMHLQIKFLKMKFKKVAILTKMNYIIIFYKRKYDQNLLVNRVKEKQSKEIYAAKISINVVDETSQDLLIVVSREVNKISKLNHPLVLKFILYIVHLILNKNQNQLL